VDPEGEFGVALVNPYTLGVIAAGATWGIVKLHDTIAPIIGEILNDLSNYMFDPTTGKRVKNDKGEVGYEDEDGCIWSKDRGSHHGGSAWKKYPNKRDWNDGKREGTYSDDGRRLRN
jgi:hypothetical protein